MPPTRPTPRDRDTVSPIRVFVLVLAIVFVVEFAIMAALAAIVPASKDAPFLSLIDSLVLVAALCPALWLLVVRPLRALVSERGALLRRTMTIQEDERARIARDLHDELGQTQTAILLGIRAVANSTSLDQAHERAHATKEMAVAAIDATRRLARGLSPSVLTDFGLTQGIDRICEDIAESSGIDIVRTIHIGSARFDPAIEIAIYRIVQEALTNVIKHADADTVEVRLLLEEHRLTLSVADNGRGVHTSADRHRTTEPGLGLAGMRQRVTLLGGSFRIMPNPAGGTSLRASIPAHPISP